MCAVAEKQIDDEDDEEHGDEQSFLSVVDGGADGAGAVHDDFEVHGGGNIGLQFGKQCADVVDGVDDVGVGLAEDDEDDGLLAVGEAGGAKINDGIFDVGDVFDADGRAVNELDEVVFVFGGGELLIGGLQGNRLFVIGYLSLGFVGVRVFEDGGDGVEADAEIVEFVRVDFDADGR